VDVEQLQELLVRARANCEPTRVAAIDEVAKALRPNTLESFLRIMEDLLSHAIGHLPALRTLEAQGLKGSACRERNSE
jgi:hypothetical protein